jgi:hypothetical protein
MGGKQPPTDTSVDNVENMLILISAGEDTQF